MRDPLRDAIEGDLAPVRPLPAPWRRAAALAPLALGLLAFAPVVFGLRRDLPRIGALAGWGLSLLECAAGLALVALALREAVPGRALSARAIGTLAAAVLGGILAITLITFVLSPTRIVNPEMVPYVWRICFLYGLGSALPAVALSGALAARAFPLRPALTGAIYGLGSGLLADAGWRLFCHFSDPGHVLSAHLAAIVAASLAGSALAVVLARRR